MEMNRPEVDPRRKELGGNQHSPTERLERLGLQKRSGIRKLEAESSGGKSPNTSALAHLLRQGA